MPTLPNVLRLVANGLDYRLVEWAPEASSATVLLLHGFMDAGATWDLVAPALVLAGYRVLAPDLRGYGDSGRIGAGGYYHFLDYVFDVADLVDGAVVPSPLYLVGHSMGGTVATMYAGTFPERVVKLALLEGLGPPDNGFDTGPVRTRKWIEDVRASRARTAERAMGSCEEALVRLKANHPNVDDAVLKERLHHLTRELPGGKIAWKHDPLHRTLSPMPFFAKLYVEYAKKIACPALYVDGGPHGYHPPDEDARLAAFAEMEQRTIEGAGHMMHWTRPAELAALLLAFFREGAG